MKPKRPMNTMKPSAYMFSTELWIVPVIYSLAAILLSVGTYQMDQLAAGDYPSFIPSILLMDVGLGKDILGVLSAALLTMTTFTFSTVLVVLTTYSSQFSPRSPENFVHGRVTRHVLGIFLGGFIYTSLSMVYMQAKVFEHEIMTPSLGMLVTFFCVAAFVAFVNFVSANVQVNTLIHKLTSDVEHVIQRYKELQSDNYVSLERWKPERKKTAIRAKANGYVQFFDLPKLLKFAEKHQIEVEVAVTTGEYVTTEMTVLHVHQNKGQELDFNAFYTIGIDRTVEQDLGYAVQKLVEVAVRAISPAVNDPNTATDILVHTGRLIGEIGTLKTNGWVMPDRDGRQRVLYHFPPYETIVYKAYYQLSFYGKEDISVVSAMSDSLKIAAEIASPERHGTLWEMQLYMLEAIDVQAMRHMDRVHLQKRVDKVAKCTGHPAVELLTYKPLYGSAEV